MLRIPAVKWNPWLATLGQIGVHVQFAKKSDIGCNGWLSQSLLSVITVAAAGYLGGREWGLFPPVVESSICLAIVTYGGILMTVMSAAGNLCFLNLFGDWTLGAGETTVLAALLHGFMYGIFSYLMAMVDMVHLHSLTIAVMLTATTSMYLQFLYHSGGISLSSDPGLWGLLMTGLGTTLACQLASVMRYYIAQANMTSFLRSIPR